jgi:hypothetical protein
MGFIEETGAAQVYRDGRIPPIYEGTNGIQAIDLAGRKLGLEDGEGFRNLVEEVRAIAAEADGATGLEPVAARLRTGIEALESAAAWMGERRGDPDSLAGAAAFLKLTGDVVGAGFLAKGALAAARSGDARFAADRAALARLFAGQVLTGAPGLAEAVAQGADELAALDEEALTA